MIEAKEITLTSVCVKTNEFPELRQLLQKKKNTEKSHLSAAKWQQRQKFDLKYQEMLGSDTKERDKSG